MSTQSDRLDRLERGLSPTRAVVAWLTAAQAHGSLLAAAHARAADPSAPDPRERMIEQATVWARRRERSDRDGARTRATTEAATDALLAYELVLTIETTTARFIDQQDPTLRLRRYELVDQVEECRRATESRPCDSRHWAAEAARATMAQLRNHDDACHRLAVAYLAGREARFPETMAHWERLEELTTMLGGVLRGAPVCRAARPAGASASDWVLDDKVEVALRVKHMYRDALVEAYRDLGELGLSPALAWRRLEDLD